MTKQPVDISNLIEKNESNNNLLRSEDKCDKYDYLIAVGCGAIGGLIDIFLVGAPGDSKLTSWTDQQVDSAVKSFAKMMGWTPKDFKQNNVASAIGFLENKFKVNYDQRYSADVNNLFNMSTKNHHIMSLSHSPDVIGLFFSILNQFTSTSSFIANGEVITIKTDVFELQGHTFISKLFCGIANWFGHIMSDIAGSSGSRGNTGRGTGIAIPFYELLQFCKFGKFNVGKDKQDLATIAIRAFQEGYDFRFGIATAIPVIITDLSIRLIWAIRQYFQFNTPLKDCIPTSQHTNLRVMLLFGNGTLCIMDGLDAGIRSGGNALVFFTRLNLIAWFRFVTLVMKEVCLRIGITDALSANLDAYKRINEALNYYLRELEEIDVVRFEEETKKYSVFISSLTKASTEQELNTILIDSFKSLGIEIPWGDDFNAFMNDKSKVLRFE